MRLGELVRLPLVPEVLLDLLEVFAGRFLFVRRLAPARVSELAHTSMLRPHAEPGPRDADHVSQNGRILIREPSICG